MVCDVILHKAGNEKVAVIIALLQSECALMAAFGSGLHQCLGAQQVDKLIVGSPVHQHRNITTTGAHLDASIMALPCGFIIAQIGRQLFTAPIGPRWI